MQQLATMWSALNLQKQLFVIGAAIAVFAAVLGLSRMASSPTMDLLYSGLEPNAAGDVIAALDARSVPYDVRGNAIYVPSHQRDALRLAMAGEGLPASGTAGYELLDTLSGFGTTAQMFDAAYWRALEGELARTIASGSQFRTARVHLGRPSANTFSRARDLTASVTVSGSNGAVTAEQARALKFLVGSSVQGLEPADVSVIDGATGNAFVGSPNESEAPAQMDRAAQLKANVERLLEARVGPGRAVVEVSVETINESEQIVERRFDPDGRVAISTDVGESSTQSSEDGPGVTVASNLPTGDAAPGAGTSSQTTRTNERINYEVSETQREVVRGPGGIRRLTVAVLVDGVETVTDTGALTQEPRSDEEIEALRGLVASAVGYDEARGDQITIMSMPFTEPPELGTAPEVGVVDRLNLDIVSLVQSALLGLVAIVLGLFVVRPILTSLPAPVQAQDVPALPNPDTAGAAPLTGEVSDPSEFDPNTLPAIATDEGDTGGFSDLSSLTSLREDPVDKLRQMIQDRQDETVGILKGWMEPEQNDR